MDIHNFPLAKEQAKCYIAGMKTIILGLGNTILTDDGVGIYVSRILKERTSAKGGSASGGKDEERGTVEIQEASVGGFNFIDVLAGYDRAVIIDAIHTKDGQPGEFYELDPNCLKPSVRISSLHGIDLATACDMAKKMKVDFPKEIKIFVMEVEDEFTFGEKCTPIVNGSMSKMADAIYSSLQNDEWI